MKHYLSYGGGVNSTAMLIMMQEWDMDFETIYVDHGCDWPETREYVTMIAKKYPITVLKPDVQGFDNLYDYCWYYEMVPFFSMKPKRFYLMKCNIHHVIVGCK